MPKVSPAIHCPCSSDRAEAESLGHKLRHKSISFIWAASTIAWEKAPPRKSRSLVSDCLALLGCEA